MEGRFGANFERVRVHEGPDESAAADAINARAFTVGQDIVFGRPYDPQSQQGERLLAHELAHTLQNAGNAPVLSRQALDADPIGPAPGDTATAALDQPVSTGSPGNAAQATNDQAAAGTAPAGTATAPAGAAGGRCTEEAPRAVGGAGTQLIRFEKASTAYAAGEPRSVTDKPGVTSSASGATAIELHGNASVEGGLAYNLDLACRRATAVEADLRTHGVTAPIRLITHGPTKAFGSALEPNRNVEIVFTAAPSPARTTHVFRVVVKSFIRHIGGATGLMICPDPLGTDPLGILATGRLKGLALLTDAMFSETGPDDLKNLAYRLYSRQDFEVICEDGRPVSITPGFFDTDVGHEGPLVPPSLTVFARSTSPGPGGKLRFTWAGKSRPNLLAEPSFQEVCPRLSVFIWHEVEGEVDCTGVHITNLTGSHFPTHRVFIDGTIDSSVPQGDFKLLWTGGAFSDPTMVE